MIFYTITTHIWKVVTKGMAARITVCDHTSIREVFSEACNSMWGSVSDAKPGRGVRFYKDNHRET